MRLKCSFEQVETDDGPTLAYHRFSYNGLSMAKQPQQGKAAMTLHKRKKHKIPHCKAHLVLFFYSDIPLSNGERIS